MNKIISVAYVILQSAFLACCNGCNQSPAPSYHEAPMKEAPKEVVVDTVNEVKQADEEKKDVQSLYILASMKKKNCILCALLYA